jgi:starch synthase
MDISGLDALQFEVVVDGAEYHTLMTQFSGKRVPKRTPKKPLTAQIELQLTNNSYSLISIGRHRLPQTISVEPGNATHASLSRLLANSAQTHVVTEIRSLLEQIVEKIIEKDQTDQNIPVKIFKRDLKLRRRRDEEKKTVVTVALSPHAHTTISLDHDDAPTLEVKTPYDADTFILHQEILRAGTKIAKRPWVTIQSNYITLHGAVEVPYIQDVKAELCMLWGEYDSLSSSWKHEQLALIDLSSPQSFLLHHELHVPTKGVYGITLYIQLEGSHEPLWLGAPRTDDVTFSIHHDDVTQSSAHWKHQSDQAKQIKSLLLAQLESDRTVDSTWTSIAERADTITMGAVLDAVCSAYQATTHQALPQILQKLTSQNPALTKYLDSFGIGEVVFASPEGPHASAGGLAQVISGLVPELSQAGLHVTVIAPLYAHENGSRHRSARGVLDEGIRIGNEVHKPRYIGSIDVQLGPTYAMGTNHHRRHATTIPLKVYEIRAQSLRMLLLGNSAIFDKLYQPVYADEQLRRTVVFSRAVLEAISQEHFGIRPSLIISNDWMTAPIAAFAALDGRYQSVPWIRDAKTVHMIHNGGTDYHGRLPTHAFNEDLWPMLNLAPEHFFGFRDLHNNALLNLTLTAARHVTGGVITVSKPYAHALVSHDGGGLETVLHARQNDVYGISNGINRAEIDTFLAAISKVSPDELDDMPHLMKAKAEARLKMQQQYGLAQHKEAVILSCVGRMAEQKGLCLMYGPAGHHGRSMLEEMLIRWPHLQLIFAGPVTRGDTTSEQLAACVGGLCARYPGRVAAHFDYIPHTEAIKIMFASQFLLMPSRFEPGGITQLEALAAGTLVIGRNVGGIHATVKNWNQQTMTGTGFLCDDFCSWGFADTAHWAVEVCQDPKNYHALMASARAAKHSWSDRVDTYKAVFQQIILGKERASLIRTVTHKDNALRSAQIV